MVYVVCPHLHLHYLFDHNLALAVYVHKAVFLAVQGGVVIGEVELFQLSRTHMEGLVSVLQTVGVFSHAELILKVPACDVFFLSMSRTASEHQNEQGN